MIPMRMGKTVVAEKRHLNLASRSGAIFKIFGVVSKEFLKLSLLALRLPFVFRFQ